MLQRLLTVMCQSLSTEAVVSSIGVTIVSLAFTMAQLHALPFNSSRTNHLQLLALFCLTLIGVLNSAQCAFASAGVDVTQAGSLAAFVNSSDWVMFGALLLPLVWMCVSTAIRSCRASLVRQTSGNIDAGSENDSSLAGEVNGTAKTESERKGQFAREHEQQNEARLRYEEKEKRLQTEKAKEQRSKELLQVANELLRVQDKQLRAEKTHLQTENAQLLAQNAQLIAENERLLAENKREHEQVAKMQSRLPNRASIDPSADADAGPEVGVGSTSRARNQYATFDPAQNGRTGRS
jgi:hypothetical protein